jgi:hypothetical protein
MSTSSQRSSSLKDPSKLSFELTRTRRLILGSYWAVILLALPLWWYTTSIQRLSLPSSRVLNLFEKHLRFQLYLQLDAEGYDDAVAKDWQGMLNRRATLEKHRWEGLDLYVHPKKHGGSVSISFNNDNESKRFQPHEDFTDGSGTYTISVGANETSAHSRHLSLSAADFLTHDSCKLCFSIGW